MLLSEAIDQIQLFMGNRTDLTIKAQTALTRAQDQLERGPTYPWFLVSEDATIRMQLSDHRIPVPADFIAEYEEGCLHYVPDDTETAPVHLVKYEYDYLRDLYAHNADGIPQTYAKVGNYFIIYPLPDDLYQVTMKYYRKDTKPSDLSLNETNKWLTYAPDAIIGKAGQYLCVGYRDYGALDEFKLMERDGRNIMNAQNVEQELSNQELLMGGVAV